MKTDHKHYTHDDFTAREHAMKDHLAKHDSSRDKFSAWVDEADKDLRACKSIAEVHAHLDRVKEMKEPLTLMLFGA